MPSQRVTAAAIQQQACMRALYPNELRKGRDIFGNFFPEAAENITKLATGFSYQTVDRKGNPVTVVVPPDLNANIYIMNRFLGVPRQEPDEILDRLNTARAVFMEKQVVEGFIEAQVKEILSRAKMKLIEAEHWPKQFVTEEEQQKQLQDVASALLQKLMAMTPEEYEEATKGKAPGAALEALKGKIGVDLAEVMQAVMGTEEKFEDEEEDEDDAD